MRRMKILLLLLLVFRPVLRAEDTDTLKIRSEAYLAWCSPEKLFVHLDRSYYASGETIWFRGYLQNASLRSRKEPSNFIYTELLDSLGRVVIRSKIKRDGVGFPGYMKVSDDLKSGYYTFRAYTLWQLNGPAEYMFTQRLKILGAGGRVNDLQADSDSLHVGFYPEGGRYFIGRQTLMAFKVTDGHGRSVEAEGSVIDSVTSEAIPASTRWDGMGMFSFMPKFGHRYFWETPDGRRFRLPEPSLEGGTVGLRMSGEDITVYACAFSGKTCTLIARDASALLPLALIPADGRLYSMNLSKSFFGPGIKHLLLLDSNGHIMSERLFYVYDDKRPDAAVSARIDGRAHGPIGASLEIRDEGGNPVDADVSVAVVRGSFRHYIQDDDIVSYMELSSELKGRINDPKHYFDKNVSMHDRVTDMNLLMLTQGWRYYDIEKILDPSAGSFRMRFGKEYSQTVSGTIERSIGKKMPEKFLFSVIIPKFNFNRFVNVEKADRFTIDSLDFPESTPFLIAVDKKGIGAYFIPKWSGESFAPPFKYSPPAGFSKALPIEQKLPLFSEVAHLDTLQAAVVTATRSDIDLGIDARSVPQSDLETYSYQGLIEYLLMKHPVFEYNGEIMYNRNLRRMGASGIDEEGEVEEDELNPRGLVKLIEGDAEAPWWSYESIHLDEIEAMSVSTHADAAHNAQGGIVAIKLRPGGSGALKTRESFILIVPLGYQKPAKFFNPRYDLGDPHDSFDHRNTIFWDPAVSVRSGLAQLNFCDTDQQDYPYIVTVQGYTSSGKPVSVQCTIGESHK